MKAGRVKGGSIIPAVIDTGRRKRSSMAQPIRNMAGSPRGLMGGAAQNVIAITDNDLVQNGGNYSLMGGPPIPMQIVTGRRSKQGAALVVYPVDLDGNYDASFAGIVYLLRDEFMTNLGAGSVNGTLAEPGPGTRTVVDTNNKLSIAADLLTFATAGVATDDPRLYYGTMARVSGRVFLVNLTTTTRGCGFGLSNVNTAPRETTGRLDNTSVYINIPGGAGFLNIGAYAHGTAYTVALVARTAGTFMFIKGGAFTNWTFLWEYPTGNTATLYPIIGAVTATCVAVSDYIRVPQDTWLPAPLLSDSFDRANGALGNTDGAGHQEANGGGGVAWANRAGTTQIAANEASASALVGGIAVATVDGGVADVVHSAELTRAGNVVGIVMRYVDSSNYVYAGHDGTNAFLIKRVADVETPVVLVVAAYAAGALCRVICDGTQFTLYYNNVRIAAPQAIADAGLQNGTECGVYSTNVGNSQDNMLTWSRDTGYSQLDDY